MLGLVLLSVGTPDGCASSETVVGREGGTLYSQDGRLALEIAPDSLETDTVISIHEVDCGRENEVACYELRPNGIAFTFPAMATFEAAELISMESIELSVEGEEGWTRLADQSLDRDDETVTASVMYLSTISVVAE